MELGMTTVANAWAMVAPNSSRGNESANSSWVEDVYLYNYDDASYGLPLEELIPVATVYGLVFVLGTLGNLLVIFSIARYRRMRNITNTFLLSLASADFLLLLICIPVKVAAFFTFTWTFGEFLCKGVHYVQNLSCICSVLTLTVMSIERYYAILHPMRAKYVCTVGRARRAIIIIWFSSAVLAIPIIFQQDHRQVGVQGQAYWCIKNWKADVFSPLYEVYMFIIMLVLPVGVMIFTYASICRELWVMTSRRKAMRTGQGDLSNASSPHRVNSEYSPFVRKGTKLKYTAEDDKTRKQVIQMLVAVIAVFLLCWTPILVNNLLASFELIEPLNYGWRKPMRQAFFVLAYSNSFINPFIYGFMSKHFRQTFIHTLCTCFRGREHMRQQYVRRQSSLQSRSTHLGYARADGEDMELTCVDSCTYGATEV